jgi:hypothetical protein
VPARTGNRTDWCGKADRALLHLIHGGGPCFVLRAEFAAYGAVRGDAAFGDGVAGIRPPLVDLYETRFDQVELVLRDGRQIC